MPDTSPRPGSLIASRYELRQLLGKGGMGVVYKAHDRLLDETVAIKFLNESVALTPAVADRFRGEIRLARKVTHRGVCRIHEYGEDGGLRYISMAFVDGVDLKQLLQEKGPPPPEQAVEMAITVAEALQAIHDEGIIHRDLKTSNIMVDARGVLRLMDFGLAKEWSADPATTMSGQLVGTPHYMSPEQARGLKAEFRSDVYSMGVVIFEIFTGAPPFDAESALALLRKHIEEPPPLEAALAAGMPRGVAAVLAKALAKDPAARHASAAELAAALRYTKYPRDSLNVGELERLRGAVTFQEWTARERARPRAARWLPWLTVALAVVALSSLLALGVSRRSAPDPSPSASASAIPGEAAASAEPSPPAPSSPPSSPPSAAPTARRAARPSASPPPVFAVPSASPSPVEAAPTSIAPPPTPPPVTPAPTGVLQLLILPAAEVLIDGHSQGSLSSREVTLAPGSHVVRVLHPDYQALQRLVTVRQGETARLVVDLAEKGVRRR